MKNLGQLIQEYCIENEITIKQFAERSGINRSYIFILRNKTRNPGVETLRRAARAMGMTYDELLQKVDIGLPQNVANTSPANEIGLYKAMPLIDDNIIGNVAIMSNFKGSYFAYRVETNDLSPLIYKNAILIVRILDNVENDSLVVCRFRGETICRRYIKTSDGLSLVAYNPKVKVINICRSDVKSDFVMYGKVVEVRFQI